MRVPAPAQLLSIWEAGADQPPARRALSILAVACPEVDPQVLAQLPVGRRDCLLINLRCLMFGPDVCGLSSCPACEASIEASFRLSDLVSMDEASALHGALLELDLEAAAYHVRFRPPSSCDLMNLMASDGHLKARVALLSRCVVSAARDAEPVDPGQLPDWLIEDITRAMAAADPGADLRIALRCPSCGHRWESVFDVVCFLWQEIQGWAKRILREVDLIARAYHWSEAQILSLQPRRRQAYIELCRS